MKYKVDKMNSVKSVILDNFSYKIVSLFVALILWLSILGRRDFVATKELEVTFVVAEGMMISSQSVDRIKVKLSGPQPLLKKYQEGTRKMMIDLSDRDEGLLEVDVPNARVDVPPGIKVLNVKPNVIKVELSAIKNN